MDILNFARDSRTIRLIFCALLSCGREVVCMCNYDAAASCMSVVSATFMFATDVDVMCSQFQQQTMNLHSCTDNSLLSCPSGDTHSQGVLAQVDDLLSQIYEQYCQVPDQGPVSTECLAHASVTLTCLAALDPSGDVTADADTASAEEYNQLVDDLQTAFTTHDTFCNTVPSGVVTSYMYCVNDVINLCANISVGGLHDLGTGAISAILTETARGSTVTMATYMEGLCDEGCREFIEDSALLDECVDDANIVQYASMTSPTHQQCQSLRYLWLCLSLHSQLCGLLTKSVETWWHQHEVLWGHAFRCIPEDMREVPKDEAIEDEDDVVADDDHNGADCSRFLQLSYMVLTITALHAFGIGLTQ